MPIDDMDEVTASGSSDDATLDAAALALENNDGVADASSSSANDVTEDGSLGIVRDVVKEIRAPDAAASSADGAEDGVDADGKPLTAGPDNDGYSDVPFHKHPRFQELITERNNLREDATRFQNVQNYLEENNLTSEEAANALHTFALAKVNPAAAFAELKPWLQELLVSAGEVLPEDLKARVAAGDLSDAAAMEISRERAKNKSHESKQTFDQQRAQRTTETQRAESLVQAAVDWEKDRKVKDPNFAAKLPLLMREVAFLKQTEGMPKDAKGVTEQLKKAYDNVSKSFKPAAAPAPTPARKPATKPVMSGQHSQVREPTKGLSTLEIVKANRRTA